MKFLLLTLIGLLSVKITFTQIQGIGLWRDHLNQQNALQVIEGDNIYAATTNSLLIINKQSNSIQTITKSNGLSDVGISCIGYDEVTKQVVIAYNNYNIDVSKNGAVKNIRDIVRSSILGDKTIYHIYCNNGFAYLSTGLGIVVVNLLKYEIKDTYIVGVVGNKIKVNASIINNNKIYAATAEGLKWASLNTNLSATSNWINFSGTNGLSIGNVQNVFFADNFLFVQKNDTILKYNGSSFSFFYTESTWPILNTNATNNSILLCNRKLNGESRIIKLNTNGTVEKTIAIPQTISLPKQAITVNNDIWIADFFGGLSKNGVQRYIPNGPTSASDGEMICVNNSIIAAAGSVNDNYNYQYNRNGLLFFEDDIWSSISNFNTAQLDSILDFTNLVYDYQNNILYAGSFGGGLLSINSQNQLKIYKQNSSILPAIGDPLSYRVSGLALDNLNNVWIANYGASKPLSCKKKDGSFVNFSIPFSLVENAVSQLLFDDNNNLFLVSPKGNGLLVYNYGNNIENINDDKWRWLKQGRGNGNLPSASVNCIAKDKDGLIWVGTKNGIALVGCFEDVFSSNCDAFLPIIKQDAFAGFLFANQDVQAIAVDAANRKWVGTKNGVWLISEDGGKIIAHFNQTNSPLLNNNVKNIVINPTTGEVFFATLSGISSYRGNATAANDKIKEAFVFPNPVPPNYKGQIGINNLPNNAIITITELNGRLVVQMKANGAQAVWNGLDYNNNKIVGGIYLVFAKQQNGSETLVSKIVVVQ